MPNNEELMELAAPLSERFAANRCSGWQAGRCIHGFPGTRFCIGSLDPVRMYEAAKPQCCDEEWDVSAALRARARAAA